MRQLADYIPTRVILRSPEEAIRGTQAASPILKLSLGPPVQPMADQRMTNLSEATRPPYFESSQIQFTSHVLAPSAEKACSIRADLGVRFIH